MRRTCIYCERTLVPDPRPDVERGYCPTHSPEWAGWATHVAYQERVRPTLMGVGTPSWPHRG